MKLIFFTMFVQMTIFQTNAVEYKEKYFDQIIDHFDFQSYGEDTFKQRYLYNDTWWNRENGPIFFYTGNEQDIVELWDNTGFISEIAPQFEALVLYAEHRYYGKSLPFGNMSLDIPEIGLLSVEQALADYAMFITSFKNDFQAQNSPVIAFGGSYGGVLAAYMRFKYPNIIHGALAASAPIYLLAGETPANAFFQSVTRDFRDISPKCEVQVRNAFAQIQKWITLGQEGFDNISRTFHLCNNWKSTWDYKHFVLWIRTAFLYAAILDYPYPSSYIVNFPAYPVKVMCDRLMTATTPTEGLYSAITLYYNASETIKCFDMWTECLYCADPTGCTLGNADKTWDYQLCTEMDLKANTNGRTDMFPELLYTSSMKDDYCLNTWNVLPRRYWLGIQYWGKDISSSSNIVFSNGNLDPWASGGVLNNISDSIVAVVIDGAAHHLDLKAKNPADPPSVIEARKFEVENIKKWIKEWNFTTFRDVENSSSYLSNQHFYIYAIFMLVKYICTVWF